MNDSGARPHDELDLEALARGDRVAADVLVELCRGNPAYVLEPDVFAALEGSLQDALVGSPLGSVAGSIEERSCRCAGAQAGA